MPPFRTWGLGEKEKGGKGRRRRGKREEDIDEKQAQPQTLHDNVLWPWERPLFVPDVYWWVEWHGQSLLLVPVYLVHRTSPHLSGILALSSPARYRPNESLKKRLSKLICWEVFYEDLQPREACPGAQFSIWSSVCRVRVCSAPGVCERSPGGSENPASGAWGTDYEIRILESSPDSQWLKAEAMGIDGIT